MPRITTLLVAATTAFAFAVAGAGAAPGDLDRSFGHRGVARTPNQSEWRALTLQRNGRIVTVGNLGFDGQRIELARYLPDGRLDPTFGNGGRANVLDQGAGCHSVHPATAGIDSQSRTVVAGTLRECNSEGSVFLVVRVLPGGDLDTSFGDQGIVLLDPGVNDRAVDLEIGPGDSILVGGDVSAGWPGSAFIVARLNDRGALDPSYGDGGTAIVPLGHRGGVAAMAVDAKGRATLAGCCRIRHRRRIGIIRLTRGGELDDSFSGDGRRPLDLGRREEASALAIGKRGRVFVAGSVAERKPRRTQKTDLALARLNSNGPLDRRFGRRGVVTTDMDRFDNPSSLEPQADGKIVVSAVGDRFDGNSTQRWVVLRYRKRGRLDHSFSGNGRAFPRIHGSPPVMQMQPNGRILLLGWRFDDADPYGFILARLRNDGRPLGG